MNEMNENLHRRLFVFLALTCFGRWLTESLTLLFLQSLTSLAFCPFFFIPFLSSTLSSCLHVLFLLPAPQLAALLPTQQQLLIQQVQAQLLAAAVQQSNAAHAAQASAAAQQQQQQQVNQQQQQQQNQSQQQQQPQNKQEQTIQPAPPQLALSQSVQLTAQVHAINCNLIH